MSTGWWKSLYVQVLVAIFAGILLGYFYPGLGAAMKPLGDAFIALVKMIIAPVIFLTVVVGIAHMGDLRQVGRVGIKALVYFEVLTTIALILGLAVYASGVCALDPVWTTMAPMPTYMVSECQIASMPS